MDDPFTVPTPKPLPVTRKGEHWWLSANGREVRLSNLTKIYWPERGYTKGDLLAYYFNVADRVLPYLADRPLTLRRMPDGIHGQRFFAKNAPRGTPDWMRRCHVPHFEERSRGQYNDFPMADDLASLLFVVNLGCIEIHPLHARCASVDRPDYLFFDLDPSEGATFEDVSAVALHVRAALDALKLPSYPKTSGATGIQVYVPTEHNVTFDHTRAFVERVGRAIVAADRDRATMEWEVAKRAGKVFIDHNMNRRGQNIAAAYAMRPTAEATVSWPLRWDELEAGVRPEDFTITTVYGLLEGRRDPFCRVITHPVDVRPAMEALGIAA